MDPSALDPSKLTGDENVAVINKTTGQKIVGSKAPPLKYLKEWLELNPTWMVDPKWSHLVTARVRTSYKFSVGPGSFSSISRRMECN